MPSRNDMPDFDPRERYSLYRLCDCPTCEGKGKVVIGPEFPLPRHCPDCRGEGRIRQEVATCDTPEAIGVALVTLGREGEWSECPFGLLDRMPECEECDGSGLMEYEESTNGTLVRETCAVCNGTGVKPTGTWLIRPWLPSARNVSDAGRVLAKSKRPSS